MKIKLNYKSSNFWHPKFLKTFKKELTEKNHFKRCERLLLKDQLDQVRTLLPELSDEQREIINVRIKLAEEHVEDLDNILEKIPAAKKKKPSIIYEKNLLNLYTKFI